MYNAMQYQGGKKSMKFLNEMKDIIPFDELEAILIEIQKQERKKVDHRQLQKYFLEHCFYKTGIT